MVHKMYCVLISTFCSAYNTDEIKHNFQYLQYIQAWVYILKTAEAGVRGMEE